MRVKFEPEPPTVTAALVLPVMAPLLVRLTVEPLRAEVGARPAPVIVAPELTVAVRLSVNTWLRSAVFALGLVALVVLVVVTAPLHVSVTGAAPLVAHTAHASELTNHAAAKTAAAMLCDTRVRLDELLHRCGNEFRERPPALSSKILNTLTLPQNPRDC
jgi:hypothetical protein